jgi:hypothetical protein
MPNESRIQTINNIIEHIKRGRVCGVKYNYNMVQNILKNLNFKCVCFCVIYLSELLMGATITNHFIEEE